MHQLKMLMLAAAAIAIPAKVIAATSCDGDVRIKLSVNNYDTERYNKLINTSAVEVDLNLDKNSKRIIGNNKERITENRQRTIITTGKKDCNLGINEKLGKSYHTSDYLKIGLRDNDVVEHLLKTGRGEWRMCITHSSCSISNPAYDRFLVTFKLLNGEESAASVSATIEYGDWDRDGYLLMPAAVYAGNRFDWRRIRYSPKLSDARDLGRDIPLTISDVPRLNIKKGPSCIQERSGSMTIPSFGIFDGERAIMVVTDQANNLGDFGMNFEELRSGGCEMTVMSPLVRERYKYEIADNMVASPDTPANFVAGDSVAFDLRVYSRPADNVANLFDLYLDVKGSLPNQQAEPRYTFEECYRTIEDKFNRMNYVPEWGYYSVGMRENFLQDWQIGWTGGMITTYPLLYSDNATTVNNVIANFDWLFPNGIAPSGLFWDSGEKGNKWYGGDIRRPLTANWHLIRKSGDGLYYVMKQFELMARRDIAVKPEWHNGTQRVADALAKIFDENGQFGQFVDNRTGEIIVGGSTSGAIIPAALVLASDYFNDTRYLDIAQRSASQMYEDYISKGISCGGPGDAMQNPDSESWYAMLESFMLLYERTGNALWLERAKEVAAQFSTWVMAYDYVFPQNCLFGKLDMQTTGAVFANTQNKHGSPGICTHSGVALMRLYRATGDDAYLDMLQQIAKCIPQYMSHSDRPVGSMPAGWISERVSTTDWFEGIGEIPGGSTWAETAMLLTAVELPSIYVDLDNQKAYTFEQLEAELSGRKLKITNPTHYPAKVKVMVESKEQRSKPWINDYLFSVEPITVGAGQTATVSLKKLMKH